jgi:N-acetylglutamate synthase-like GNAT family acetyltransferase
VTTSASDIFRTTHTGFKFRIRQARPEDEGTIKEFFGHVSQTDLRFRFLSAVRTVSPAQVSMLANPSHQFGESFLAFTTDGSMMIATGMLAWADFERGEVAIAIREDQKHRGVGWELLDHIAQFAESKGIRTLESIESRDNHDAIELEREMGFVAREYPGDPTLVLVSRSLVASDALT